MKERIIHVLRRARNDWYRLRDRPSLEEALAEAILAEFAVMDPFAHARMEAEVATARIARHIKECEER